MFKNIRDIETRYDYSLKNLSTFRIGGKTKYYIICHTLKALIKTLKACLKFNIKFKVVGGCSNILFDDLGFNGAIIKLKFNYIKIKKNKIKASSDISLGNLINLATKHNLSGLENFIGIPAHVGGAIFNNLGAFEKEISNNLIKIKYLKIIKNKLLIKSKIIKNTDFSYRKCNFLNNFDIILFSEFKLKYLDIDTINLNLFNYFNKKATTQPLNCYSLGSVFKRGNFPPPAKLIDELGLKGKRIGGAEISKKHAGFIVNINNATCKDVLALIDFIKKEVKTHFGYELKEEIEFLPF